VGHEAAGKCGQAFSFSTGQFCVDHRLYHAFGGDDRQDFSDAINGVMFDLIAYICENSSYGIQPA
jgi:hypothetical protein